MDELMVRAALSLLPAGDIPNETPGDLRRFLSEKYGEPEQQQQDDKSNLIFHLEAGQISIDLSTSGTDLLGATFTPTKQQGGPTTPAGPGTIGVFPAVGIGTQAWASYSAPPGAASSENNAWKLALASLAEGRGRLFSRVALIL